MLSVIENNIIDIIIIITDITCIISFNPHKISVGKATSLIK